MAKVKITKRFVDSVETKPEKPTYHWDPEIIGFGLQVLPSGSMAYVFQYRDAQAKSHRATIAKAGTVTPDEARRKAGQMRRELFDGIDPLKKKVEIRNALTVADLFDAYLESEDFKLKSEATRKTDKGRIVRHLKPLLGRVLIENLTVEVANKFMADVRAGKTAKTEKVGKRALARVRGGEGVARKCMRLLKSTLAWGRDDAKILKIHPLEKFATGPDGKKTLVLEDKAAYGRMRAAITKLESEKIISQSAADAIRVISYTGARRGEISKLKWKHVDLTKGLITIPYTHHKTGRKTGEPRIIGLPAAAQALIEKQPPGEPDDYVFEPAKGDGGEVNLSKPWGKIRKEAKLPTNAGLHTLRHTLATDFAEDGAEAADIMTALGHRNLSTSQGYIHARESKRQALAERAAARAIAGMAEEKAPAEK